MRAVAGLVIAWAALLLTSSSVRAADKKPQELIVGKWASADPKNKEMSIEFTKGGDLKINIKSNGTDVFNIGGKYKFIDEKTLEVAIENPGKKEEKKSERLTIKSISAEELILTSPDGKDEKFTQAK